MRSLESTTPVQSIVLQLKDAFLNAAKSLRHDDAGMIQSFFTILYWRTFVQ